MIIGLTGYAQHGKDSTAKVLVEEYGFTRMAFADKLREFAYRVNPYILPGVRLVEAVDAVGWDEAKTTIPEVRRLLQAIGTEGGRDVLGPDVWVDAVSTELATTGDDVVFTDVRFPNEAQTVKAYGGQVWRISRLNSDGSEYHNGVPKSHPSEAHIASLPTDAVITAVTLEDLAQGVRATVEQLGALRRG